ncbi:MAG: hypothetical protein L6V93_15505 [Clostridiales bacterium]|nr:MAG: hypothetical protein L6V93_15505 [Clostridiales bacterium]
MRKRLFATEKFAFDMFFRKIPDGGGFAVMAGVEQLVDYLENLHFDESDIEFLRSKNMFCDKFFWTILKTLNLSATYGRLKRARRFFPGEPIVKVKGPVMQAQFIETMLLLTVNHQSLVATKANRIVRAAKRQTRYGIRFSPCTGSERRYRRRACGIHRRLLRYCLHNFRRPLRHTGARNNGA